jgi:3-keto steroid reductase
LVNLLQQSPSTLQFAPRIIHTSSRTAAFSALRDDILADPQLVQAPRTYAASKYLATLMMSHFDREYGNLQPESTIPVPAVRCLNVDPGAVQTNVMDEGFRAEGAGLAIYIAIMRWGYWLAFVIVSAPI